MQLRGNLNLFFAHNEYGDGISDGHCSNDNREKSALFVNENEMKPAEYFDKLLFCASNYGIIIKNRTILIENYLRNS
jgi:hypothetical protein